MGAEVVAVEVGSEDRAVGSWPKAGKSAKSAKSANFAGWGELAELLAMRPTPRP
jgi:hypothetical protein